MMSIPTFSFAFIHLFKLLSEYAEVKYSSFEIHVHYTK